MSKDMGSTAAAVPLLSDVLLALAARCEREMPSRKLDDDILQAIGFTSPGGIWTDGRPIWKGPTLFTNSLDAAISLVPINAWRETNGPRRSINIPSPVPNFWRTEVTVWEPRTGDSVGWGPSEALSICAAALKARAAIAKAEGR